MEDQLFGGLMEHFPFLPLGGPFFKCAPAPPVFPPSIRKRENEEWVASRPSFRPNGQGEGGGYLEGEERPISLLPMVSSPSICPPPPLGPSGDSSSPPDFPSLLWHKHTSSSSPSPSSSSSELCLLEEGRRRNGARLSFYERNLSL